MHTHDSAGLGRNERLNLLWVYVMRVWIYIAKNWPNFLPLQCMGCSNKRKRWDDHFTLQVQSINSNFQPNRCITSGNAMLNPYDCCNTSLQFLNIFTVV